MKGIVFSFKKSDVQANSIRGFRLSEVRYFFKRYGIRVMFVGLILIGLAAGSVYARNADSQMLSSLDFLFTTNFEARMAHNFAGTFCACFTSDFIFVFSIYLLGLAPWGIPIMLLAVLFKGFGTGITAGYLFIANSLAGVGFYLLVLLPGTFLFCIALVLFSTSAFEFSKELFFATVGKNLPKQPLRRGFANLSSRLLSALIMTFCASLLDTALWTLFAGSFNF